MLKDELYKPFGDIRSRKGRGGTYDYITWKDIADRMNNIFGMNWSSEVITQERIGDDIIVRVKVYAKDPESPNINWQEGFGGATLRSSDEPGSAHKSAYSKALKDACKKWGIGLYLEDDPGTVSNEPMPYAKQEPLSTISGFVPPTPTTIPNEFIGHTTGIPVTQPQAVVVQQPDVPSVSNYSVPVMPSMPSTLSMPSMPEMTVAPEATMGFAPPERPTLPSTPLPSGVNQHSVSTQQVVEEPISLDAPGTITNVQEMAIKQLARLVDSQEQSIEQFIQTKCSFGRPLDSIKNLSYNEAVNIIKTTKSLQ